MKTKILITSVVAIVLVIVSFSNADAGRWHRRGVCRPSRVVVVPRVVVPRIIVPRIVARPHCNRVYVHHAPRVHRHHRHHWR